MPKRAEMPAETAVERSFWSLVRTLTAKQAPASAMLCANEAGKYNSSAPISLMDETA